MILLNCTRRGEIDRGHVLSRLRHNDRWGAKLGGNGQPQGAQGKGLTRSVVTNKYGVKTQQALEQVQRSQTMDRVIDPWIDGYMRGDGDWLGWLIEG